MQQQISVITLGVIDLAASKRFYVDGFGWKPVFEQDGEIVFYQMNGLMLGTWRRDALERDMQRSLGTPGAFTVAHNVASAHEVQPLIDRLVATGGKQIRKADGPPHGGLRGYVADPDDHTWEIAYNPAWPIDAEGHVTFGA